MHPLEVIDNQILRLITGAQQKVPLEMLFLETGELPLKYVIIVRRLMYYQEILKRHEKELVKRVFTAMKIDPLKGDWINLIIEDLKYLDMTVDNEEEIKNLSKNEFRRLVKNKIKNVAFKDLEEIKDSHEKVKHIAHEGIKNPQDYLVSKKLTNKEKALLFNLRSRSENQFKENFHNMYNNYDCSLCGKEADSQEHALTCELVTQELSTEEKQTLSTVLYSDLFGCLDKQIIITKCYMKIISIKKRLSNIAPPPTAL